MGIPKAGSWEITDIENHPKGGSFFFLKFLDTRFNPHSMVSLDVMIETQSLNSLSRVILMNFLESKFNSLSHPVNPPTLVP